MIIKIDLKMVKIQVFILSGIIVERILKFFSASDFFSFFFLLTSFWRFYVSFHSFLFRFLYVYVFFFFLFFALHKIQIIRLKLAQATRRCNNHCVFRVKERK